MHHCNSRIVITLRHLCKLVFPSFVFFLDLLLNSAILSNCLPACFVYNEPNGILLLALPCFVHRLYAFLYSQTSTASFTCLSELLRCSKQPPLCKTTIGLLQIHIVTVKQAMEDALSEEGMGVKQSFDSCTW